MSGFISGAINTVADAFLTPEELAQRESQIQYLEALKSACVVIGVAAAVFFALLPNIFTFLLCGLIGLGAKEVWIIASNMMEVVKDITVSVPARLSRESEIAQLSKDTLFAKHIFNLYDSRA